MYADQAKDSRSLGSMHEGRTGRSYSFLGCLTLWSWKICLSRVYSPWRGMLGNYFQPEGATRERRHLFVCFFFLEAKMLCSTSWAGKCMLTHFWDCLGQLMEHYSPMEITINREAFCDLLQNHLKSAVRSRCRGLLSSCVLLRRDKAQPHTPTCNSSTNYEYVLGVSSTSNAFIWYRTMWLSHVWTSVEEVQHKR